MWIVFGFEIVVISQSNFFLITFFVVFGYVLGFNTGKSLFEGFKKDGRKNENTLPVNNHPVT